MQTTSQTRTERTAQGVNRMSIAKAVLVFATTALIFAPCLLAISTTEYTEINLIGIAYGFALVFLARTHYGRRWMQLYMDSDARLFGMTDKETEI